MKLSTEISESVKFARPLGRARERILEMSPMRSITTVEII